MKFFYHSILAAVLVSMFAAAPAAAVDQKTFLGAVSNIEKTYTNSSLAGVKALLAYLEKTADLTEAQELYAYERAAKFLSFMFRREFSDRPAVLAALREHAAGNMDKLAILAYHTSVARTNPYPEEVLKMLEEVVAKSAPEKLAPFATRMAATTPANLNAILKHVASGKIKPASDPAALELYGTLALQSLRLINDQEGAKKFIAESAAALKRIKAAKDAYYAQKTKRPLSPHAPEPRAYFMAGHFIGRLLDNMLAINKDMAVLLFDALKPDLEEGSIMRFEIGSLGAYALKNGDFATFGEIKKKFLAIPRDRSERNAILPVLCRYASNEIATELLTENLKNPDLSARDRFHQTTLLRSRCGNVSWYLRKFNDVNAYPRWRKYTDELIKLNDSQGKGKLAHISFFLNNAYTAYGYGDFDFAIGQIERALQMDHAASLDTAVMIYLWKKDTAKVSELVAAEKALFWRVVDFFNKGGKMATFDQTFAAEKLDSTAKLRVIRRASELFFRAKRNDVCRDIYNHVMKNMYISLEPKKHTAVYWENPPQSADGFAQTPRYKQWDKMETRFVPYGESPNISTNIDITRFLKDTEKPQIDPGWKTGIYFAWDIQGLYIYVRCDDPEIIDVKQEKRKADVLECTFRPHANAPYHMWFFHKLPSPVEEYDLDFASPTPRYRKTKDFLKMDAAFSPDGLVALSFIPWVAYYDHLPFNGKCWYYGMQRWGKISQTISGQAHEMARMVNIQFDFTPEQELAIKRNICRTTFNRFKRSTTIPVWKTDDKLGDPEFYKSELDPLVKELEEAGKLLDDEKADINAIFKKYVPQWAEFEHTVAEKRRLYLKKKFFE